MSRGREHPFSTKEIFSGTAAGVVGTLLGHPLDTVKVRLQTQHQYKGMIDCFIKVFKTEGVTSFYRGVGHLFSMYLNVIVPPLISLTFLNSFAFGTFGELKRQINKTLNGIDSGTLVYAPTRFTLKYFLAGSITGWLTGIFSTPFEMVKLQMQLDNVTHKRFKGSFHCARTLLREKGISSLYTGYGVNTVREIAFCGTYFGVYENVKHELMTVVGTHFGPNYSAVAIPVAGGLSGATAWFLSFPLDCIKANIQGKPVDNTKYRVADVAKHIWETRGFTGFYSGVSKGYQHSLNFM